MQRYVRTSRTNAVVLDTLKPHPKTLLLMSLKEFLSFAEKKPDKQRNLKSILDCKRYLMGFIKYPKRPSQITQTNCCKVCSLSSKV